MGTWKWDAETDLLDVDEKAAEIFGWPAHVPVTRSALRERAVIAEDRALTTEALTSALNGRMTYRSEYRVLRQDGSVIWVHSSGISCFSSGQPGEVVGMIGTVQDITERRTQEATLKQTEMLAATGRMAATIAHEINNPLEAVTNLIFLAKANENIPDSVRKHLEMADEELARVGQIAQQTLGFYRDTSRPLTLNLAAIISDVIAVFERRLSYKQMLCRPEFRGNLEIVGLQGELRQAVSNLLLNAIDAASNGGVIRIRARETRILKTGVAGVSVAVYDSGSGISDSAKKKLFSPFFTTKQSVGTRPRPVGDQRNCRKTWRLDSVSQPRAISVRYDLPYRSATHGGSSAINMKKTTLFKQYLLAKEILMIPVFHDPLCATIIQRAGFKVVGCGGYANSAALIAAPTLSC